MITTAQKEATKALLPATIVPSELSPPIGQTEEMTKFSSPPDQTEETTSQQSKSAPGQIKEMTHYFKYIFLIISIWSKIFLQIQNYRIITMISKSNSIFWILELNIYII